MQRNFTALCIKYLLDHVHTRLHSSDDRRNSSLHEACTRCVALFCSASLAGPGVTANSHGGLGARNLKFGQ